jgi:HEXXH motif-containing protein
MSKLLAFQFPELCNEDKASLRRVIRALRAQVLHNALGSAKSSELADRLGEHLLSVHRFLGELISLSDDEPDLFWRAVDHWSTAFLLSRLFDPQAEPYAPEQLARLTSNLSGLLLFERLTGRKPMKTSSTYATRTDSHGRIFGLLHGLTLEIHDPAYHDETVEWICSSTNATVQLRDRNDKKMIVQLPLQDDTRVRLAPIATAGSSGFPVLDEAALWDKPRFRLGGVYEAQDAIRAGAWNLTDSLSQAQETLKSIWPSANEWLVEMIPAFVDMGALPNNTSRFSSSFDPGTPIFLSRVDDPICHAEDAVHELQHHRLVLVADDNSFKSWSSPQRSYVSPYRPDPRPLRGVLLGLHAFLTVNELRKKMIERKQGSGTTVQEMVQTHYMNLFAFRTVLEHEELGPNGKELFSQIACTLSSHHVFITSLGTPELKRTAEQNVSIHIESVVRQASDLKNTTPMFSDWNQTYHMAASFS